VDECREASERRKEGRVEEERRVEGVDEEFIG